MDRTLIIIIAIIVGDTLGNIYLIRKMVKDYKKTHRIPWGEIIEDVITMFASISMIVILAQKL